MNFLRNDPIRGGRWYAHPDGDEVHEHVFGGHVWRGVFKTATPVCVFCEVRCDKAEDPSWERCPKRGYPALPTRRWPFASLPFPSQVVNSVIHVEPLPVSDLGIYAPTDSSESPTEYSSLEDAWDRMRSAIE